MKRAVTIYLILCAVGLWLTLAMSFEGEFRREIFALVSAYFLLPALATTGVVAALGWGSAVLLHRWRG